MSGPEKRLRAHPASEFCGANDSQQESSARNSTRSAARRRTNKKLDDVLDVMWPLDADLPLIEGDDS